MGYKFTITDGYGDGICCNYGQGGYSVKVDDKEVASGGQFGSSDTKPFNVGSSAPVSPPTAAPVSPPTSPTPDHLQCTPLKRHLQCTLRTLHLQCTRRQLQILYPLLILPMSHQQLAERRALLAQNMISVAERNVI